MGFYRAAVTLALLLVLLAGAAPSYAVLHFSGYDSDNGAGDDFEGTEVLGSGTPEETDLETTTAAAKIHNKVNGGGASSKRSRELNIGANEQTWDAYTVPATGELTVGFSLYVITQPNVTDRRFFAMVESDGSEGCQVLVTNGTGTNGRALRLTYDGSASLGASTEKFQAGTCCATDGATANENTDDCLHRSECTSGASCPTAAPNCLCDPETGKGCYHGLAEVHQKTVTPTTVQCDIVVDGRLTIATGVFTTTNVASITGFRLGALDTVARSMNLIFDDLAWNEASRVYPGYVETTVVDRDGTLRRWNPSSGTSHFALIDDYVSGGTYDEPTRNVTSSASRRDDFSRMTPAFAIRAGDVIEAAETLLIGTTNATVDTREFDVWHRLCPPTGICTDGTATRFTIPMNESSNLWARVLQPTSPGVGNPKWTIGTVTQAAWSIGSTLTPPPVTRLSAALTYWRVKQPDEPLPITLSDHNQGTDDGVTSCWTYGDSTNGGTFSGVCPDGGNKDEQCSFDSYCSWDDEAVGGTEDHPTNGCGLIDANCFTCTVRDVGNGIWYPCEVNADCSSGTCVSGKCSQNDTIPCGVDADCSKGTCDNASTGVTCVESCPGSSCPERVGWGNYVLDTVGCNVGVHCAIGLQNSTGFLGSLPNILAGEGFLCEVITGQTYPCSCAINKDCGACSITSSLPCTVASQATDCPSPETCTAGTCGTDTYGRGACVTGPRIAVSDSAASCAYAGLLSGVLPPPPDNLNILIDYNDVLSVSVAGHAPARSAPNCKGASSTALHWPGGLCDTGTPTLCSVDSDCTAISADSQCVGFGANGSSSTDLEYPCLDSAFLPTGGLCTLTSRPCRQTSDCAGILGTATCSVNEPTNWQQQGYCLPGTCPAGTVNRNGKCWKTCTADSGCGGVSTACISATSCKGVCTHPSNSAENTCATPADCVRNVTMAMPFGGLSGVFGKRGVACTGGKCACTGYSICAQDTECPGAFLDFYAISDHTRGVRNFHTAQGIVDALSETDGRPLLIWNTPPEPAERTCFGGGRDDTYFWKQRNHLLAEFPYVVDAYKVIHDTGKVGVASLTTCPTCTIGETHSDSVHHTAFTGALVGKANADFLGSLGTCAKQTNTHWGPHKYCRNLNKTWATTSCVTSAECTAVQFCEPRHCGCVCRTNQECVNWFGAGMSCSTAPKHCIRTSDGVDSCDVAFDTGSQTWTCDTTTDKRCEQAGTCTETATDTDCACPSAADACRVE